MLAIERNSSELIELSVQQMVDCAANNCYGCLGGDTCNLLEWLVQEKVNIHTMKEYPMYGTGQQCKMVGTKNNVSPTVQVNKFTCDR